MMNGKTYIIRKHKGEKQDIVATNIKKLPGNTHREKCKGILYCTWRVGWSGI